MRAAARGVADREMSCLMDRFHVLLEWKTFTFKTRRAASGAAFRGKGGTKRRARVRKLLRRWLC